MTFQEKRETFIRHLQKEVNIRSHNETLPDLMTELKQKFKCFDETFD